MIFQNHYSLLNVQPMCVPTFQLFQTLIQSKRNETKCYRQIMISSFFSHFPPHFDSFSLNSLSVDTYLFAHSLSIFIEMLVACAFPFANWPSISRYIIFFVAFHRLASIYTMIFFHLLNTHTHTPAQT